MTDYHLIHIIWNSITSRLHQAVAHYEDLCSDLFKWNEKVLYVDIITAKFQKWEQDNRNKDREKKRSLEEQVWLTAGVLRIR